MVDGARYGHPDFTPSWEWVEKHNGWFEAVFIISDDGFGVNLFVQNEPEASDADSLRAMFREYAEPKNGE
ncbi:hypothetical protein A8B75_15005 [Sphingomonadales bacterium EhC05]|nr:hypothetical protein A8B75_15005 [Sphingomonadales bacterium EhC05]